MEQVYLQVYSKIQDGEEILEENQELQGELTSKDGTIYLRYVEWQEGVGEIKNTLKFRKREVQLIRHGAVRMNHTFKHGEDTQSFYQTPLGRFEMDTKTLDIQCMEPEQPKGEFKLEYILHLGQTMVGQVNLFIQIDKRK